LSATADNQPHLKRVLGRFDLVLLFVVAVFNLNVVPSIAANGGVTVWLWIIALLLFFWPQGIAVIELAHRYPGEGGVYLWAKEVFGDFHGFLSGWCYWTNNMLYVPTVMLYFVGVSVFAMGPSHAALADDKTFAMVASVALLAFLTALNVLGLGVGKWLNNVGGIGTFIAAAVLIGLGLTVWSRFGSTVTAADFILRPLHFRHVQQNTLVALNLSAGIAGGKAAFDHADFSAILAAQAIFKIPDIALARDLTQEFLVVFHVHVQRLGDIQVQDFVFAGIAQHANKGIIAIQYLALWRGYKDTFVHMVKQRGKPFFRGPGFRNVFDDMDGTTTGTVCSGVCGSGNHGVAAETRVVFARAIRVFAIGAAIPIDSCPG